MKHINLYYWSNETNVGDIASLYIVKMISNDQVQIKSPFVGIKNILFNVVKRLLGKQSHIIEYLKLYEFLPGSIIFAIGSILDFANYKCIVWGSGFREYDSKTNCRRIYAVRGYLTLDRLENMNKNEIAIGDPAILLPWIYKPLSFTRDKEISIIPHYKDYDNICQMNIGGFPVINIMTENVEGFINQIVASKYILSTSLHGVIIAHAYNVPALWIKAGHVGSSDYKYHDYFSSVYIKDYPDLKAKDILNYTSDEIINLFKVYRQQSLPQIDEDKLRIQLLLSAPFELKDSFKQLIGKYEEKKNIVCH